MIKPESLVINPELVAVIGVETAHVLELPQRALDAKSNADFLGPFTLYRLIECFALFDATAGKFRHVGRANLGRKHDCVVTDSDCQRKYAAARLDS
jgi:hypothetical protein